MLRVLFTMAVIVSLSLGAGEIIIAGLVKDARSDMISSGLAGSLSVYGAIFSALCLAFLVFAFIISRVKVEVKFMKMISLIGILLTGICFLLAFVPMAWMAIKFDAIGIVFLLAAALALALSVAGMVYAFREKV